VRKDRLDFNDAANARVFPASPPLPDWCIIELSRPATRTPVTPQPPTSIPSSNPYPTAGPLPVPGAEEEEAAYGYQFWCTYASNALMMVAFSLLFRYSDFVHILGGNEFTLGLIVGAGMIGSLSMRLFQGLGIDNYGSKQVWLVSNVVFIASLLAHLLITRADGPAIYVLRVIFQSSIAGVFGASITYISRRAPLPRVAEIVGTLGTSGFIGMMAGTTLGDVLCHTPQPTRWEIDRLFLAAAFMGTISLLFAMLATHGTAKPLKRRQPPLIWLLRRYHPGIVLLMGIATGFGVSLPQTFLRPYTAQLGLAGMALFFWAYTIIAFITRICIRRMPEKAGIRPMILIGVGSLAAAMLCFLIVETRWQLIIPAFFTGVAHAMLFPAIVAGGSTAFPTRFRGLGTTLMLSMVDFGSLIGNPTVGGILHINEWLGLPRYTVMFVIVAGMLLSVGLLYAFVTRKEIKPAEAKALVRRRPRKRKRHGREKIISTGRSS
jgi:MFS family permease